MHLFRSRRQYGFGKMEALALGLYGGLIAWLIPHHESWVDEAQSWLIARDSSFHDLFWIRTHHEGSPGLWHLLLWILARMHVSFAGMHWVTGAIACCGVYVLLRYAPFPAVVRYLLPFTFFLQYQYAIVARSYVFFPLLVFWLAATMSAPRPRPLAYAVAAALLANVSMHGLLYSGTLTLVYLWMLWRTAKRGAEPGRPRRGELTAAAALLCVAWIVAIVTAFPTPDVSFGGSLVKKASCLVFSHTASSGPACQVHAYGMDALGHNAAGESSDAEPPGLPHFEDAVWKAVHTKMRFSDHRLVALKLVGRAVSIIGFVLYPFSSSNLLAGLFGALAVLWFVLRRSLLALLPFTALCLFSALVQPEAHHTGLDWIALLAALWTTWDNPARPSRAGAVIDSAFQILLLIVILVQIGWSAYAIWGDTRQPYSGDQAAALYIRQHAQGRTIAGIGPSSIALEPYFPGPIYSNQPLAYWPWSYAIDPDQHDVETFRSHPDILVMHDWIIGNQYLSNQLFPMEIAGSSEPNLLSTAADYGYQETHRFCGWNFIRFGYSREQCVVILEPAPLRATR